MFDVYCLAHFYLLSKLSHFVVRGVWPNAHKIHYICYPGVNNVMVSFNVLQVHCTGGEYII